MLILKCRKDLNSEKETDQWEKSLLIRCGQIGNGVRIGSVTISQHRQMALGTQSRPKSSVKDYYWNL